MDNVDVTLPDNVDLDLVPQVVEDVCACVELDQTLKTTLKKFPGCLHWHFKRSQEKGILEVTWWPRATDDQSSRLWLSVHGNRTADWIEQIKPQVKATIEERLASGRSQ